MGEIKVSFTCFKCYYMMGLTCPFNTFACFCATRFPCFLLWCLLCAFVPFPRLLTICPTLSAFTCDLFPPLSQSTLCGYLTAFSVIYPRFISLFLSKKNHSLPPFPNRFSLTSTENATRQKHISSLWHQIKMNTHMPLLPQVDLFDDVLLWIMGWPYRFSFHKGCASVSCAKIRKHWITFPNSRLRRNSGLLHSVKNFLSEIWEHILSVSHHRCKRGRWGIYTRREKLWQQRCLTEWDIFASELSF